MFRTGFINFAHVKPWWLRLGILLCFASPLITGGQLHPRIHPEHVFQDIALWSAYAVFVWLFISACIGVERLVQWLSLATILGLTVAFTGAAFRKLNLWEAIERIWAAWLPGVEVAAQHSELNLIFRFLMIIISLPYALFALSSFPAFDLLSAACRRPRGRRETVAKIAIFLRVFQYVFELVTRMLVAWREENPELIVPRHRRDWRIRSLGRAAYFNWLRIAILTWSTGLLVQSLQVLPVIIEDWERFLDNH